jgi:hypothetical protein
MARYSRHLSGNRIPAQTKSLEKALPEPDRWWLVYVSLVAGCAVGCFTKVDAFEGLVPTLVGRIVTALLVGGGSQIVHAVVNKARDPFVFD